MIKYNSFLISFVILFLYGCDIGSSNATTTSSKMKGYLIDSKVSGIQYECSHDNINGITNKDGLFYFSQNCNNLSFKLGNTILASIYVKDIPFDNKLFITDLVGVERNNSNNIKVINVIKLLQTFDIDNNPHNGIDINNTIKNNITNYYTQEVKDITTKQELKNILVDANYTGALISKIKALVHLEQTLRDNNINIDTVAPFHPELDLKQFTLDSGKILIKLENNITTVATPRDSLIIKFYAEYNSIVSLNNSSLDIIVPKQEFKHSYIDNFELNISDYNITLTDTTNKTSLPLNLHIIKDTNIPTFNSMNTDFNITIPDKLIVDINVTDLDINTTDTDANGLVVYEIISPNKNLFDINKTGYLKFKTNTIVKDYNITIKVTDFARHDKDINLTIHSIN